MPLDRAVMNEKAIGDGTQAGVGFFVADADRLLAEVAAGHHQGRAEGVEQQLVQRRVGEHDAEVAVARRHRGGQAVALALLFVLLEVIIGAGLVRFGWVKDDTSLARAVVIAIHLVNREVDLSEIVF